jgi:hypothetical protein
MNKIVQQATSYLYEESINTLDLIEEGDDAISKINERIEKLENKKKSLKEKQHNRNVKEKTKTKLAKSVRDKFKKDFSVSQVEGVIGTKDERIADAIEAIEGKVELLEMKKEKVRAKEAKRKAREEKREAKAKAKGKKPKQESLNFDSVIEENIKDAIKYIGLGALGGAATAATFRDKERLKWGAFAGSLAGAVKYFNKMEKDKEILANKIKSAKEKEKHLEREENIGSMIIMMSDQLNVLSDFINNESKSKDDIMFKSDWDKAHKYMDTIIKIFYRKNKRDDRSLNKVENLILHINSLISAMISSLGNITINGE